MRFVFGDQVALVPASHEDPQAPGVLKKVLLSAGAIQSGDVPMVNWSLLRPGRRFALHYHQDMQEIFMIVSGTVEARVWSSDQCPERETDWPSGEPVVRSLGAGDLLCVDPREVHQMINVGQQDVVYLVFGVTSQQGGKTITLQIDEQ